MASPNTGGVDLTAATAATILTAGGSGGTYVVTILNRSATVSAKVKLGISTTTNTLQVATQILHNKPVLPEDSIDYGPIVIKAGEFIVAESDVASVNAMAMGYDK